jgi:hypothetical protein
MDRRNPVFKIMASGDPIEEIKFCVKSRRPDLKEAFSLLNKHVFNNELKMPKFIIRRTRGYWGMCEGMELGKEDVNIVVSTYMPSIRFMVMVLAHEMVHQWEWVNNGTMTHGPGFFSWRDQLSEYGVPLKIAYPREKFPEYCLIN